MRSYLSTRLRRLALTGVGVIVTLVVSLSAQTIDAPIANAGANPSCPGWSSTIRPPDYIRVLRRHSGQIDRVPFKKYVVTVLGKEWPGYLPPAVIQAGAVAVKQYAWFHALGNGRVSRNGQCYDVTDGTGDQLYKPNKARIRQDHYDAIALTWDVRLLKHGSLFMTGYRTGNKGACGHDATGWKLFARSATRCAYRGDAYQQILRIYYGPVSVGGSGGGASDAGAEGSDALTIDFSASTTDTTSTTTDTTSTTTYTTTTTTAPTPPPPPSTVPAPVAPIAPIAPIGPTAPTAPVAPTNTTGDNTNDHLVPVSEDIPLGVCAFSAA